VATARPSRAGEVNVSLLFAGAEAPAELELELVGRREQPEQPQALARELAVHQMQFERQAALPVTGPLRVLRLESTGEHRRLIVVDADREMVWDVTTPDAPVLLSSTPPSATDQTNDAGPEGAALDGALLAQHDARSNAVVLYAATQSMSYAPTRQ
jgi:hypothetical protein